MPTCADWKRAGFKRSGNYTLDPDSPTCGVEPFEIYCDMQDCTTGVTVIHHDSEDRTLVQGCEEPGCFSQQINYEISMAQIRALMARSSSCEQYIRYECYGSVLLHDGQNEPFGWWVSRDGQKMTYWGGAEPGSNKCACGEQGLPHDIRRMTRIILQAVWIFALEPPPNSGLPDQRMTRIILQAVWIFALEPPPNSGLPDQSVPLRLFCVPLRLVGVPSRRRLLRQTTCMIPAVNQTSPCLGETRKPGGQVEGTEIGVKTFGFVAR
uniref:Uncharacterized protein n=1 Tax=Branchiostoma floridae TaxID=7739 RepID=C3ZL24_BRAFL|eukprot:XP_002590695.1 hypothetical protein BRAFLDRAFT_89497 [Branchiostoma floridae]